MAIFRCPVNVNFAGAGSPGVNVWHFRVADETPADGALEVQSAVDAIHGFYMGIKNAYPASTNLQLGDVIEVSTQQPVSPSWATIYGNGGDILAPQMLSIVVSWRTNLRARRGMGRTFLGPLVSAAVQGDGTPNDETLGLVKTSAQALIDASSATNGWAIGVWGLQVPAPPGTPPSGYLGLPRILRDFTGYRVKDRFGIIRSRRD